MNLFKIAFEGRLDDIMAIEGEIAAKAVTGAVRLAASYLTNNYKRQTTNARLGQGVTNAWQNVYFPKSGKPSIAAATQVYSKADRIVGALSKNQVVRPTTGDGLLVPTQWAVQNGLDKSGSRSAHGGIARRWLDRAELQAKLGPLFELKSPKGETLLCYKDGRGIVRAVAYVLRSVRLKQLIDLAGPRQTYTDKLPKYIVNSANRAERNQKKGSVILQIVE